MIQNLNYGGMERVLSDIAFHCDHERFDTHVLCLDYLGRFSEGLESVATLHVAAPMSRASMLWPRSLARQIRAIDPDVVHSHTGVWYKATLAARLAGVPRVVHTEHGRPNPDRLQGRLIDRLGAGRCDVIVAVSDPLALHLARALGIPKRKVVVIRNGVDTQTYHPRPDTGRLRAELGISAETPIIGSIGRLEPIKAYDIMVEAFARLRARGRVDAVLLVAGEGSERPRLERLVRERGLERTVFLPGWRDDVHDMHSAFSLFTMSSTSEGTSISLLEAMSAGLAPVVTDVGGNANVLGAELRRCLVPSGEPDALALAWEDTLLNPELARERRAAARQRVIDSFGLKSMVGGYEAVYLEISPRTEAQAQDRGVRGVPPSPRSSAEWPPVM